MSHFYHKSHHFKNERTLLHFSILCVNNASPFASPSILALVTSLAIMRYRLAYKRRLSRGKLREMINDK